MNQEFLKDMFEFVTNQGYTKSYDEFVNDIQSNKEFADELFSVVNTEGYTKSQDDFYKSIGYDITPEMPNLLLGPTDRMADGTYVPEHLRKGFEQTPEGLVPIGAMPDMPKWDSVLPKRYKVGDKEIQIPAGKTLFEAQKIIADAGVTDTDEMEEVTPTRQQLASAMIDAGYEGDYRTAVENIQLAPHSARQFLRAASEGRPTTFGEDIFTGGQDILGYGGRVVGSGIPAIGDLTTEFLGRTFGDEDRVDRPLSEIATQLREDIADPRGSNIIQNILRDPLLPVTLGTAPGAYQVASKVLPGAVGRAGLSGALESIPQLGYMQTERQLTEDEDIGLGEALAVGGLGTVLPAAGRFGVDKLGGYLKRKGTEQLGSWAPRKYEVSPEAYGQAIELAPDAKSAEGLYDQLRDIIGQSAGRRSDVLREVPGISRSSVNDMFSNFKTKMDNMITTGDLSEAQMKVVNKIIKEETKTLDKVIERNAGQIPNDVFLNIRKRLDRSIKWNQVPGNTEVIKNEINQNLRGAIKETLYNPQRIGADVLAETIDEAAIPGALGAFQKSAAEDRLMAELATIKTAMKKPLSEGSAAFKTAKWLGQMPLVDKILPKIDPYGFKKYRIGAGLESTPIYNQKSLMSELAGDIPGQMRQQAKIDIAGRIPQNILSRNIPYIQPKTMPFQTLRGQLREDAIPIRREEEQSLLNSLIAELRANQ